MRKLSDLVREEPVALTGLVGAVANVAIAMGAHWSGDLVASVNVLIGAGFMALRWLVVSPATAERMVNFGVSAGYAQGLDDVKSLAPSE